MLKAGVNKFWILILSFFLFNIGEVKGQCAMCRAVLETEASGEAAKGLNDGIVYLMVIPYILVGIAAFAVFWYFRRRRKSDPDGGRKVPS